MTWIKWRIFGLTFKNQNHIFLSGGKKMLQKTKQLLDIKTVNVEYLNKPNTRLERIKRIIKNP